jgi:glutamate 5-kinase
VSAASEQAAHKATLLRRARRIVVKIGSNVLAGPTGLRLARIRGLANDIAAANAAGGDRAPRRAQGAPRMAPGRSPVGQPDLMAAYVRAFRRHSREVAQVLLTHADLADRRRYLNARHTLRTLLTLGVVPIVNENDTVAVEELQFGDNDNLSALTATLVEADLLVILSDVAGVFDADPRLVADARRLPVVAATDPRLTAIAGPALPGVGTGGMASKVAAAKKAAAAGISTVIADGSRRGALGAVLDPAREVGTLLLADGDRLARRKHWIAHALRPAGTLHLDAGAERALAQGGRSLLPSGVRDVEGTFGVGDCVRCVGPGGEEVARGLVNYGSADVAKIMGAHTREIEKRLGYKGSDEVIHRDDLVVVASPRAAS